MSEAIWVALIVSVAPFLMALAAYWQIKKNNVGLVELHLSLNSRLTELLKVTAANSHAAGNKEGKAEAAAAAAAAAKAIES